MVRELEEQETRLDQPYPVLSCVLLSPSFYAPSLVQTKAFTPPSPESRRAMLARASAIEG